MENNAVGEHEHSRWSWQAKLGIVAVILYLGILFSLYLKLKHLPGPYYGGDLYAHHGFALNYIMNGFWVDPYFIGNYAFYPQLGNYLFILISLLPGLSLMQSQNFVSILTSLLSAGAFYFLGRQLFKNKTWALVLMLFSLVMRGIPGGAPNNLPWMITIPFWFAFWLKAEDSGRLRDKVFAGLFMGFTSLSQIAFFMGGMAVFMFTIIVNTLLKPEKKKAIAEAFRMYGPMLLVGFLVSLPFYGPIIVNYQAETLNPLYQYNGPNIDTLGVGWAAKIIWKKFVNFSSTPWAVTSILTIIGFAVCLMNFKNKSARYAVLWLIAGTLAPLHHLVTRPLFDRWVLPGHLWSIGIALLVFLVFGIRTVTMLAEKKWPDANVPKIMMILVLIVSGMIFWGQYSDYTNDKWVKFGQQLSPSTQAWLALGDWVKENTDDNAVFLTHEESCFAVNGVSGRKCVFVRRTHANYFVDIEQRFADGVIMMYGNNTELTDELIDEYKVDYFLLDQVMMQQPVLVDAKFEAYLTENKVKFDKVRARKDPAAATARTFDLLAVPLQPFNKDFEDKLEEVARFNVQEQAVLRILKVSP